MTDNRFTYGQSFTVGGANAEAVEFTPFIESTQGLVGYRVIDMRSQQTRYMYMNASDHDPDDLPNVFVYEGAECDPAQDDAQHWYEVSFSA